MKFTKMHGLGNDYIFVDCFAETVTDPSRTAQLLSPAHFGVGADGLILIEPSAKADCRMRMFNADGTEGRMWATVSAASANICMTTGGPSRRKSR